MVPGDVNPNMMQITGREGMQKGASIIADGNANEAAKMWGR
jgi:hypothetical protein